MNKNIETTKPDTDDRIETTETIATAELDTVTGGCSRCGCGQPDAVATQGQFAANWRR